TPLASAPWFERETAGQRQRAPPDHPAARRPSPCSGSPHPAWLFWHRHVDIMTSPPLLHGGRFRAIPGVALAGSVRGLAATSRPSRPPRDDIVWPRATPPPAVEPRRGRPSVG